MDVRIVYSITAICQRPGRIHKLLHTLSKSHRNLEFGDISAWQKSQYGDDNHRPLICSRAWLPSKKLLGTAEPVDTTTPTRFPRPPPPYSPAVFLDAVFPHPLILSPGEHFAHGLFVTVPPSLQGKVVVRSLVISLHRTITARIGPSARIDRAAWPVWSIRGRIPLQHERASIACGQLSEESDRHTTTYGLHLPSSIYPLPSFASCCLSRVYFLHIRMGISVKGTPAIHYIETSIDVDMSKPPPAYFDSGERVC